MPFITDNNLSYLTNKLCDSSNIKVTGNSKGNRVNTVLEKIVDKIDKVTNAVEEELTNNNHFYKVGTGNNNVDLSADVQDGFGEVGIKGVTYQNVLNNFSYGSEISKYITANNKTIKWTKPEITSSNINIKYHNSLAQTGKVYTLIFYIYKNTLQIQNAGNSYNVAKFNVISYNGGTFHISSNKTGWVKAVLIQPTTITSDGKPYLEVYKEAVGELEMSYPILLEGDHTNNVTPTTHFEGIIGLGDKSKNLFNKVNLELGSSVDVNGKTWNDCKIVSTNRVRLINKIYIKPNTTYTLSATKKLQCVVKQFNTEDVGIADMPWKGLPYTFTTKSNASTLVFMLKYEDDRQIQLNNFLNEEIQLEEGTIATDYQPYGNKIEILSHGKNLYKPNLQITNENGLNFQLQDNILMVNGTATNTVDFRQSVRGENTTSILYNYINKLPVGTTLTLSNNLGLKNYIEAERNGTRIYLPNTLTITKGDRDIGCFVRFESGQSFRNQHLNIQLEINQSSTEFKPYQEDKTQVLLDEPLMKLPNGVYDEITKDGKLIKRVGKVVLNGSESWGLNADLGNGRSQFVSPVIQSKVKPNNQLNIINDKLVVKREETNNGIWLYSYLNQNTYYTNIVVHYNFTSIPEFKQWLSANPITVYYELSTPIITEIDPVTLRIFKDGRIKFNTLIAPESTHVVQLNKPAQIERNIKEVQKLNNKFNELENFYDDIILETNHKLNLLNFDFEYTKSLKESEEI